MGFEESMLNILVVTVSIDGLALLVVYMHSDDQVCSRMK